ncbi:low-density lipoprotein receptor-related protein 4 isoform X2 [Contarinia nasturtii]|uniref:low-density lipoprotein receptor-related protein 4 isoform X2 n=1 Tax=Contarinia nasturtii TaxID=265458 RepID=UPI0012D40CDC|nr:low-density lipoprotein receptor-related protein 4 isoform X2 [Contarinia nasturtii]
MNNFVFVILTLFFCVFFAPLNGETSDSSSESDINPVIAGAARQIYGSSSLRTSGNKRQTNKRRKNNHGITTTTTHQPRFEEDYDDYDSRYPHGTMVIHEQPPFSRSHFPPPVVDPNLNDARFRHLGPGVRVPSGNDDTVFGTRHGGERQGDTDVDWKTWDRFGTKSDHDDNQNTVMHPDDDFMHMANNDETDSDDRLDEQLCTLGCLNSEFLCPHSCQCVPKYTRCNGVIECDFQEDEENCGGTSNVEIIQNIKKDCESSDHHVLCPKTFACIAKDFLCDGDNDCGDFSDETHCGAKVKCEEDQFECDNGLCIQHQWVCDGDNDCQDYSDEVNCTAKLSCTNDEWMCTDTNCISASFRCDGEPDCVDASDEQNCITDSISQCPEGEFRCGGSSINYAAAPGTRCILNRFRCDGENDCADGSDEVGCLGIKAASCSSNEFKCGDGTCIPIQWKCDMEQDCDSGDDEKSCKLDEKPIKRACADDEYQCKDGRCILKTWLCDSIADCKRAEDETNCQVTCDPGQFLCPMYKNITNARICVNQKHRCDGQCDCVRCEDEAEENCPKAKKCDRNSKCEQLCVTTHDSKDGCACRTGFVLHENKHNCTDIDECQFTVDPVCSQKCINTVGSFQCSCTNGYILRPDLRTCKALGGAVKLILANRVDIRQVSLSNNRYTSIVKGLHNAIAIDFHYKRSLLFWSDVSTDVIKMSYMNGTSIKNVIKWGLESPGGIAVDWTHDLLFFTDSGTKRIEVSTFDGSLRAVIIANDLNKPRAIVVHPGEALIFFTDWGTKPRIDRAYMDGTDRRTIISDGIFWPNGLTLDYSGGRIYWADAKHHVIESSHFDGSDRKKILSNHLPHPFALTLFEDHLYWTDWNTKSISAANKVTGKGFRNIHIDLHFPMDIHSYHSSRQPEFLNRCQVDRRGLRGGCSHLCLPNKSNRRCGCPIGLTLKDDQKTCTDIPDKLLIISRKKDIRVRQLLSKNSLNEHDMVVPIDGLKSTIGIDWCQKTDTIYWTDVGRSAISRAQLNGDNQTQIIQSNLISPAGLALDWITDKIYYSDMGTNRIEVATIDGRLRTMLIWQGIEKPRDIVVNPIEGLMFWCDWGSKPQIERSCMDGSERKVLVSAHLQFPNGLAIDYSSDRLYFVDSGSKTMESVKFDGSARRTIIDEGLVHPFGIEIYDQKVYWTDMKTLNVESANKNNGKDRQVLIANVSDLMDVRVFHRNRKMISNLCSVSNGDCSHLCLLNSNGYRCACPIGVKLSKNGRTCNDGPNDFIIFARRTDIRQISLDYSHDYLVDVVLPLPSMSSAVTVDVDSVTGDIYWSDTNVIMKSTSDGIYYGKVIGDSLGTVESMIVDSIGRKIYFTDSGRLSIEVCELNGSNRAALVYTDLDSPRGIAIDYADGMLFFSDWGKQRIERVFMDGEQRIRIVEKDLGWPNALSTYAKRLFWTDASRKLIESCNYEGNHRKIILQNLEHPYGLAVTTNHIYYTDWKTMSLHLIDKHDFTTQIVRDNLEGLMDVKFIERERKRMENVCGHNNGNCSHLCLRNSTGFSCRCPTGIKLKTETECHALPENYLLIAMRGGIGRISFDTDDMLDVALPIENVHAAIVLDYHYNKSKLYYADVNVDVIKEVDLKNVKNTKTIVSSGLKTTNGLTVDWIADNLYFSDTETRTIEVTRLDGSCRKTIINENLNDPRSLAISPQKGYLFFSDWGKPQRIERCFLDGSGRKIIVSEKLGFPTGLCVDFNFHQLYWADALEDRIEVSNFEGHNRKYIVEHTQHPFSIALYEKNVFWSNWYNKSVSKVPKRGQHKPIEIRGLLAGALDIRVISQSRQPNQYSPCMIHNGNCTHLCLYRYTSYVCECPDKADSRTCQTGEFPVTSRPKESFIHDYPNEDDLNPIPEDNSSLARIVAILTAVFIVLLIIVLCAILYLVLNNSKKKENHTPRSSTGSVLTFSNPNYNLPDDGTVTEPKVKIWKRLKYDKAQDRVYEERCFGENSASATLMPSGKTPSSSSISRSPLSTIG